MKKVSLVTMGVFGGAFAVLLLDRFLGAPIARLGIGPTTTAFIVIAAFLSLVYFFTRTQEKQDGEPMSSAQTRFLALYLVSSSVLLLYLIFQVMSVRPSPPRVTSAVALQESSRPSGGLPTIVQVLPDPL